MRDHVTEERISAYVDGELEGDELELVERLLAESAEHRQLLAELQELRASMQPIPNFNLPADFQSRVVSQIKELGPPPTEEPVATAARPSTSNPWNKVVLAAASLAAMIAVTVMLRPPSPETIEPIGPIDVAPTELPVFLQQWPQYVMVYDVTVTPTGQDNEVVEKLLTNLGIAVDPALRLGDELEKELMAVRESIDTPGATEATPYKQDQATPKSGDDDKVEMIYVASTLNVLDQFYFDLEQKRSDGEELSDIHYDMVIEPNKLGVMHRLHESAREHYAQEITGERSDIGQAFRISFRLNVTNVSMPGTGVFRIPTTSTDSVAPDVNGDGAISAADALGVMSQLNQSADRNDSRGKSDGAGRPTNGGMEPGHILLILRHIGANAEDAK